MTTHLTTWLACYRTRSQAKLECCLSVCSGSSWRRGVPSPPWVHQWQRIKQWLATTCPHPSHPANVASATLRERPTAPLWHSNRILLTRPVCVSPFYSDCSCYYFYHCRYSSVRKDRDDGMKRTVGVWGHLESVTSIRPLAIPLTQYYPCPPSAYNIFCFRCPESTAIFACANTYGSTA